MTLAAEGIRLIVTPESGDAQTAGKVATYPPGIENRERCSMEEEIP